MNIAQNYPKIHVSEKTAFLRSKNDIQPKTKVVPNTSTVHSIKTEFFYCLIKLSFNYKKINLKAPGDLYCWDI